MKTFDEWQSTVQTEIARLSAKQDQREEKVQRWISNAPVRETFGKALWAAIAKPTEKACSDIVEKSLSYIRIVIDLKEIASRMWNDAATAARVKKAFSVEDFAYALSLVAIELGYDVEQEEGIWKVRLLIEMTDENEDEIPQAVTTTPKGSGLEQGLEDPPAGS